MDPAMLAALATAAANAFVTGLATPVGTSAIESVKAMKKLLIRQNTEEEVAVQIQQTQEHLEASTDSKIIEEDVWSGRFMALLRDHPEVIPEVQQFVESMQQRTPQTSVIQRQGSIIGSGNMQIQSGGDTLFPPRFGPDRT